MRTPRRVTSWVAVAVVMALAVASALLGVRDALGGPPTGRRPAISASPALVATPAAEVAASARSGTSAASGLLGEAVLPSGARALPGDPSALLGIEPQTLLPSAGRFDAHRFYTVPFAPSTIVAFVRQHLLGGESASGPQPEAPPGGALIAVAVPGQGGHLQEGAMTYEAVPSGGGSALRVDATVVWNASRPADERVPASGAVLVTGYEASSLSQYPSGPVTVRVTGTPASKLRRAFDALPLTASSVCMETETAYSLRFLPADGAGPSMQVTEHTCPSPGSLAVTSGGTRMAPLQGDCALLRLVVAALPAGKARYTQDRAGCGPPMP